MVLPHTWNNIDGQDGGNDYWRGIGNALTHEHHDTDMAMIREVGANTIRLAHYQHDQYFYDLCDRYGMRRAGDEPQGHRHL